MRMPRTALRPTILRTVSLVLGIYQFSILFPHAGLLQAGHTLSVQSGVLTTALFVCGEPPDSIDESQTARNQQLLNQVLYRNRRQQVTLMRARQELETGNIVDGLAYLQEIFDQPEDTFLWNDSQASAIGARSEAAQILESLDPDVLVTYQRLYSHPAEMLLKAARESGQPQLYVKLYRRYYHTQAGYHAVNWLASRWFDRGHFRMAARSWNRLIDDPFHQHRVTPTIRFKTVLARRLSESSISDDAILNHVGQQYVELGGESVIPAEYVARRHPRVVPSHSVEKTLGAANVGQPGTRMTEPTSPYLKPLWNARFSTEPNYLLEEVFRNWNKYREEQSVPSVSVNSGIVADGRLILRDFETIHAFDIDSGRSLWKYRCETSMLTAVTDLARKYDQSRKSTNRAASLVELYTGNSVLGTMTTDGFRVYAVDFMEMSPSRSEDARRGVTAPVPENSNQRVSREANRLIALNLQAHSPGEDVGQTPLWSIGGAVGAPNWFYRMDKNDDGRIAPGEFVGTMPQFKEIDADGDEFIERSEAYAINGDAGSDGELAGHFFLGPPLAATGKLYALTEADRQLNLVALQPESGELLWSQGIGFVDRPIDVDAVRYPLACTPSYADGIVICPTQLGVVVAVDGETGTLLWAYDYGDRSTLTDGWLNIRISHGSPGFSSVPLVTDDHVVVMPRQSKQIHCIELSSGRAAWRIPREDAEYVASINESRVLIVGRQYCRGISLESGKQVWSSRIGTPCGRGLPSGPNYLLPLQEGRIATIEMSTGREIGYSAASSQLTSPTTGIGDSDSTHWRPGNLVAAAEILFSVSPDQIVAFPQTAPLLKHAYQELAFDADSPEHRLLAGELELVQGDLSAAKKHLSAAMKLSLSKENREHAENLMREQLYLELNTGLGDPQIILAELDGISKTAQQRGRYLIQRAESQLKSGRFDGVLEATREFAELELDGLLPMVGNERHLVSAASWIPSVIGRVQREFGPAELERVHEHVDVLQQIALDSNNMLQLEQFLSIYSRWPQAAQVRTSLSNRLIAQARYQQAELLLLENRGSDDPFVAATATVLLVELWDRLGLAEEAASLLAELEERFGDVELEAGLSARKFVADYPRRGLTGTAYHRLMSDHLPAAHVRISEERWIRNDPALKKAFDRYRRKLITPQGSTFQLLDKSLSAPSKRVTSGQRQEHGDLQDRYKLFLEAYRGNFRPESTNPAIHLRSQRNGRLTVINRQAGLVSGEVAVPTNFSYRQVLAKSSERGHFFPLGSPSRMHGISLLEHQKAEPLWTTLPEGIGSQRNAMRVGPYGPSFCTFQSGRHLAVVDPAVGRVRWQRTDIDPNSGLHDNSYTGLFGDAEVLVLFSAGRQTYTVYRTTTGEELRHGKLDIDSRQPHRVFGRKLFYFTPPALGKRLRIWDPLEDRHLLDMPVEGRVFTQVTADNELVVVAPPDRIYVFDVFTGEVRLNKQLDSKALDHLTSLQVFGDHDRYFINLQRHGAVPASGRNIRYARERFVPAVNIKGDLYAVDRSSGRILWKHTEPERSFLLTPHVRLPFLIAISHLGGSWNGNHDSMLVEVIDAATGESIGRKENLLRDCILDFCYEADERRIELHGKQTVIDIEFDPKPLPLVEADGRL